MLFVLHYAQATMSLRIPMTGRSVSDQMAFNDYAYILWGMCSSMLECTAVKKADLAAVRSN